MELIPFLIFAVIAFNIFRGFAKAASKSQAGSAKEMLKRYQDTTPTQRGRERLDPKGQNSPWRDSTAGAPSARVAAKYLQKTKAARKAAHKSPEQTGRRGRNVDQNRKRTDEWGQRGDEGLLTGKTAIILLVIGGAVLYALAQIPAN